MQRGRPPFGVGQERLARLAPLLPDSALTLVGPQTEAESRVTPPWSRWCCVGIGSGRAALLLFVTLFPLFGTSVPLPPCVGCVDAWVSLANQMVVLVPGCCDRDWPCRLFRTPLASYWGSAGPSQLPSFSSVAMRLSRAGVCCFSDVVPRFPGHSPPCLFHFGQLDALAHLTSQATRWR